MLCSSHACIGLHASALVIYYSGLHVVVRHWQRRGSGRLAAPRVASLASSAVRENALQPIVRAGVESNSGQGFIFRRNFAIFFSFSLVYGKRNFGNFRHFLF